MAAVEYIKPAKKLPVIFLVFVDIIVLIAYYFTHDWPFLYLAFLLIAATAILYSIISKWNIEIDDEQIIIKGPVYQRIYLWKDISATFITSKLTPFQIGSFYWYFESTSEKRSGFEVNYFTQNQLRKIAEIVIQKCSPSIVDIKISNMAKGNFPWFVI